MASGRQMTNFDPRNVSTLRQPDHNRVLVALSQVVLIEAAAKARCLYARDRIDARVELISAAQTFRTERVLLQIVTTCHHCVDQKSQQLARLRRIAETRTAQDLVELPAYGVFSDGKRLHWQPLAPN